MAGGQERVGVMGFAQRIHGYLHYEHIPLRGPKHQYRVADDNDEFVADFGSELEAAQYCKRYNDDVEATRPRLPGTWRGHPQSISS